MPEMPPAFRRRTGGEPVKTARQEYDDRRGSARSRGYDARWERESKAFLRAHPLCAYCELDGIVTAAALVDHLYPHRGDKAMFWEKRWWVPACKRCHDGFKKQIEMAGRAALNALARRLGVEPRS